MGLAQVSVSSSNLYKTNLMSYLNSNTELLSVNENEEFLGYINNELFGLFTCENGEIPCKINLYEGE